MHWLHLYLGLGSGLIVFIVATTGCLYSFQKEITEFTYHDAIFVNPPKSLHVLPLQYLKTQAETALGKGKEITFISTYQAPERAWKFESYKVSNPSSFFYLTSVEYYYIVMINPYTGKVNLIKNYKYNFFNIIKYMHWSLLINHPLGQQIVGSATIVFIILLISGLILWLPKNFRGANFKRSFKIKWGAKLKRINYDLHNVLGFYTFIISLILGLTGLVWAFGWFQTAVYTIANRSAIKPATISSALVQPHIAQPDSLNVIFETAKLILPDAKRLDFSFYAKKSGLVYANGYMGMDTYSNADELLFNSYNGELLHQQKYIKKNSGEKLIGMNYDIHVGAIGGIIGKIIAFIVTIIIALSPITGLYIWLNKRSSRKR